MRVALVNPRWTFDALHLFRLPRAPSAAGTRLLPRPAAGGGHECLLVDGHICDIDHAALAERGRGVRARHDRASRPRRPTCSGAARSLNCGCRASSSSRSQGRGGRTVAVGPHGSVTPETTLRKLGVDVVVRGECEEIVAMLAEGGPLASIPAIAFREGERDQGHRRSACEPLRRPSGAGMAGRMGRPPSPPSPSLRSAAGRSRGRGRGVARLSLYTAASARRSTSATTTAAASWSRCLPRSTALIAQGARYLYFIDEIFLPQKALLEALVERPVQFGIQTRIDLWKPDMLDLLGRAGCVSIEAGVESLTVGRPRGARQELPALHRRTGRPADPCANARAVRPGEPDRHGRRRCRPRRGMARTAAAPRRVGQRSRAALSLSELAGLSPALGRAGRRRPGSARTSITSASSTGSATSRTSAPLPSRNSRPPAGTRDTMAQLRILMTTDAVGGVWTYALDLARGLAALDIETVLAVLGPTPTPRRPMRRAAVPGLHPRRNRPAARLDGRASRRARQAPARGWPRCARRPASELVQLHAPALAAGRSVPRARRRGASLLRRHLVERGEAGRAPARRFPLAHRADRAGPVGRGCGHRSHRRLRRGRRGDLWPAGAPRGGPQRPQPSAGAPAPEPGSASPVRARSRPPLGRGQEHRRPRPRGGAHRRARPRRRPARARRTEATVELRHARPLGPLCEPVMQRWLADAPVFASLALYEPFGLGVLEAAQAGCALVLSDIPTFRELWNGAALFVPPDDDAAIAGALDSLLWDDALRDRMARQGARALGPVHRRAHGRRHGRALWPPARPSPTAADACREPPGGGSRHEGRLFHPLPRLVLEPRQRPLPARRAARTGPRRP